MEERLINNASFSKICTMLQKKKSVWDDVKPILQATLLVIPALVSKEIVTAMALREALDRGLVWLDAGEKVENAFSSIKNLVSKQDEDFVTRAENAQIANVLLVFSAFFDTVKIFLPDKDRKIYLDEVQYCLTEKSLKDYQARILEKEKECVDADGKRIVDWKLVLPNPLEGLAKYEKRLEEFYSVLCASFRGYLDGLSCTEDMQEHLRGELNRRLELIPKAAVGSYKEQYYALAAVCPDFFVWTNQNEHQQQRELVDRGFQSLSEQIRSIPEAINEYTANEALTSLNTWYSGRIRGPIIPIKELPPQDKEMRMPTREKCFIPQAYEWLIYRERMSVEATDAWKEGGAIGQDILNVLRSPELGSKPILILGDPGAGKTTLCHMLAGKILCGEYHVIVVHLRDINAEASVAEQIGEAIARTLDDSDCKWGNIAKARPKKPVLLIFDGYDELLQAKGKTYSNYLEKIVEFQEKQWDSRNITVRSIVTSRIVLIDKVEIPSGSVVIRLKPFDKDRIDKWCEVWNNENEAYFQSKGLEKFVVEEESKAWELAGEPLLLLMLALFDTKDNALRKHQNLQATELYGSLIRDFVEREKKKDPEFEKGEAKIRKKVIEKEIERIAVVAIGMFNRNALHITAGQLEKDLGLLCGLKAESELKDSEQLLGSFFFIHDSATRSADIQEKDKLRAYTFLHNTFGEFLAAHYIVIQLYNILDDLQRHVEKYENKHFSLKDRLGWYACLSYAPLFRRPVVGRMVQEWAPRYFESKRFALEDATDSLRELIIREIPRVLRGEVIGELECVSGKFRKEAKKVESDLMEHLAIYSNNLLSIAALLTDGVSLEKSESPIPRAWNKLLHLWRYAFDENEIAAFAGFFKIEKKSKAQLLVALDEEMDIKGVNDRASKIYKTYQNLQDEPARSVLGALLGVEPKEICQSLNEQGISAESRSILLGVILGRVDRRRMDIGFSKEEIKLLHDFPRRCLSEGDYSSLYGYYLVLNDTATISKKSAKNIASALDPYELTEIYAHCERHHPIITVPILSLVDTLRPVMSNETVCLLASRFVLATRDTGFESLEAKLTIRYLADLLLKCIIEENSRAHPRYQREHLRYQREHLRYQRELLEGCWVMLREGRRYFRNHPFAYEYMEWCSSDTLEILCLLNIEAKRLDPEFPCDFIDEVYHVIPEYVYEGGNPTLLVPLIDIMERDYEEMFDEEKKHILLRSVNRIRVSDDIPKHLMLRLVDFLLNEQTDTDIWMNTCVSLLDRAEHKLAQWHESSYDKILVEKLALLNLAAYKINQQVPLEFTIKYSMLIAEHINDGFRWKRIEPDDYGYKLDNTSLLILLSAFDNMLENKKTAYDQIIREIRYAIGLSLHIMRKTRVKQYDVWMENPQVVILLCHTIQEFSEDIQDFVVDELTNLVRRAGCSLSLEICRELTNVAGKLNNSGLKEALADIF